MEVAVAINNTVNKNQVLLSSLRKENKEKREATLHLFQHTQV
jgi:hypothetical protein